MTATNDTGKGIYRVSFYASGVIAAYREDIKSSCIKVWPFTSWTNGIMKDGTGDFEGIKIAPSGRNGYCILGKGNAISTNEEIQGIGDRLVAAIYRANRWHYCKIWFSVGFVVEDRVYEMTDYDRIKQEEGR